MKLLNLLLRARRETIIPAERRRFSHSMLGETATTAAARLGCIAG